MYHSEDSIRIGLFISGFHLFLVQGGLHLTKSGILSPNSIVSKRSIMAAILQTVGPVSTTIAIRANWKFLKCATAQQFSAAAVELEKIGFGQVVSLSGKSNRSQQVFVKKHPSEAQIVLESNPDLCSPDVYATRFHRQATKTISWNVRAKLVSMGLVSQKQFM